MTDIPETKPPRKIIDDALGYAAYGWAIFPAPRGEKKSYSSIKRNGVRWGATTDPDLIKKYWRWWPGANIGIACTESGIVVIEADTIKGHGVDGIANLKALQDKHPLLDTLRAISPSGSIHHYFLHPGNGIRIKPSKSEIAPGVDIQGDGNMVIAPPSVRADGAYRWLDRRAPVVMPASWIELTRDRPPAIEPHINRYLNSITCGGGYVATAFRKEIEALCSAIEGARNAALNSCGFCLFQFVHAGHLERGEVINALINACIANGLMNDGGNGGTRHIMATIKSAEAGARLKPRRNL